MAKAAPSCCFELGWVTPQQRKGGREKLITWDYQHCFLPGGFYLLLGNVGFFFSIFLSLTNPNGQIDMFHHAQVLSQLDPLLGLSAGCIEGNQTTGTVLATACQQTNYPSLTRPIILPHRPGKWDDLSKVHTSWGAVGSWWLLGEGECFLHGCSPREASSAPGDAPPPSTHWKH